MSACSSTDTTETPMSFVKGMCSWMYCASSLASIDAGAAVFEVVMIPHAALVAVASSEEAGVSVLAYQRDELIDRRHIWCGLIAVPLHVVAEPEDPPATHGAHVGGLRDRDLDALARRATERRSHFEYLHALTEKPERQVAFLPQMARRPATFDESRELLAYARGL